MRNPFPLSHLGSIRCLSLNSTCASCVERGELAGEEKTIRNNYFWKEGLVLPGSPAVVQHITLVKNVTPPPSLLPLIAHVELEQDKPHTQGCCHPSIPLSSLDNEGNQSCCPGAGHPSPSSAMARGSLASPVPCESLTGEGHRLQEIATLQLKVNI